MSVLTAARPIRFSDQLRALVQQEAITATTLRIPKHAHIYNCGERDGNIYLIESGQVKTVSFARDGKRCLLSIHTPGDVFGELCMLRDGRTETATAMKKTSVRRITTAKLMEALSNSELQNAFIQYLTHKLSEQQQFITNLVTMDSQKRLAVVLLRLARKLGKPNSRLLRIEERITQEELAWMVGTTRSRVGFFLKRFHDEGLVHRTSESYLVVDEPHLTAYVEAIA